jgi:tRNA-dihydrouridine synthase B
MTKTPVGIAATPGNYYIFVMWIGNLMIPGRAVLAPMAGVTDIVFRRLCRRFGAAIVYSEFLSTDGLVFNTMSQEHKLALADDEHPVAYQLFGSRVETFAAAARQLAEFNPDMIDLNFGCPVKKVVGKNGGAAILKDLDLMARIVREACGAVPLPVTVKMRAGWDHDHLVYQEAALAAVAEGAKAVTLHARTRIDGYETAARWAYIADLKSALKVPVIGNGDVESPEDACAMLEQTACDAVMVGRGALGRPWIFAQINHYLETGDLLPEPAIPDRMCVAWRHLCDKLADAKNDPGVVRLMRKQMAAYVKGWPDGHMLKAQLMSAIDPPQIREAFAEYLSGHADLPTADGDGWIADYIDLDRDWLPCTTVMDGSR